MTTQIRTTLLTGLFFFGLLTGLQAQDKYEYARVTISALPCCEGIYVSISGKEPEEISVKWKKINAAVQDYTPLLNHIEKMTSEGWEVITVDTFAYYLKRKKS